MQNSNPELIIGIIYSTNCYHCVELLPKWKKMKKNIKNRTELNKIKYPTYLEIEANNMNKLNNFNNINRGRLGKDVTYSGFPTVFKIYGNNIEYYESSREPIAMENFFMKEKYLKNKISTNMNSTIAISKNINALKNNTKKRYVKLYKKSHKNLKIPENKPNKIMQRKTRKFSFF